MDEEIIQTLPPLIDDFDSWLQSSYCNPSFNRTASYHDQFQGVSAKYEQQHQIMIDDIQNVPPLLEDFDSWFDISSCNLALPYNQFQDDFDDYELLMGEKSKGSDSPDYERSICDYENRKLLSVTANGRNDGCVVEDDEMKMTRRKNVGTERAKDISFAQLSKHFYMPITQAAKKMNVGLTVLKKKCREFGIPRWPHRKMKSLRSLIDSVQELGKEDGQVGKQRSRLAIEVLEEQVRQMEKMPAMEMPENTKRLRQACFKANYKKRRLHSLENSSA